MSGRGGAARGRGREGKRRPAFHLSLSALQEDTTLIVSHTPLSPCSSTSSLSHLPSPSSCRPVRPDLSMTGEISLTGKVLPVGGIREKIMAARRSNCMCVILPRANKKDYDELPEHLKEGLEVHFAASYAGDVYPVAFEYPADIVDRERDRLAKSSEHPANVDKM